MKAIGRFLNSLSVKIIGSIVVLVTLLIILIGILSYQVFTTALLNEIDDRTKEAAEFGGYSVEDWPLSLYLEMGQDTLYEHEFDDYEELRKEFGDTFAGTVKTFGETTLNLIALSRRRDIVQLGLIVPDASTGYSEASVIFYFIKGPKDSEVDADIYMDLGERITIVTEADRQAIRRIMERESTEEIVIDYSREGDYPACMIAFQPVIGGAEGIDNPDGVIVVVRTIQNVVDTWNRYVIGLSITGAVLILIGILMIGLYLRVRVVKPVAKIVAEADRFARESIRTDRILAEDVGSITEIRTLAKSIDKMERDTVDNMEELARMSRESERMDTELALAGDLQKNLLPKGDVISRMPEIDVSALMEPAREVGGDFYDFFLIDGNRMVLLIADVSDKGMGAAFFMAVAKTLLKGRAGMGGSAAEIITYVEEKLSEENENGMFITTWLGILDLTTGDVNACNAGHNFPAILKADSEEGYQIIKTEHGPPLCFLPGLPHIEYHFRMNPGDRLFLYTDGVTEAKNPEGERFGNDRLLRALNDDRVTGNESLILRVKAAVDHFAGAEPQFDDITMVSLTFLGT